MTARRLAIALAFGVLASLPFWMPGIYYVNVASQILLYAVFALGLNVIVGYGGLIHQTGLSLQTGPLLALLLTLMIVSLLGDFVLQAAARRVAPWYEAQR